MGVEVASGVRQATFAFFLEYRSWLVTSTVLYTMVDAHIHVN